METEREEVFFYPALPAGLRSRTGFVGRQKRRVVPEKAPKREATRSIPDFLGKCRNEDF
jgi:hypothetical protein